MSEEAPRRSVMQAAQRFLVFLFIVALGGAVVWLLSQVHAKTYAVEQHEGELWVMRGRELPVGFVPYRPTDKVLAEAYAPIPLVGDSAGELVAAPFDDRDSLDQALFRTLKSWIDVRLESEDPDRRGQALKLLKRAEGLTGVSSEQRVLRKDLEAKVAYVEGRAKLEEAEAALREAVARLRTASESRNRYAREAGDLYERTAGLAEQLSRALRLAPEPGPAQLPAEHVPPGLAPEGVDAAVPTPPDAAEPVPPPGPVPPGDADGSVPDSR